MSHNFFLSKILLSCLVAQLSCRKTCTETFQAATPMITATLFIGTLVISKKVVPLIGINVTLILNPFFVIISLFLLPFSWLAVAMLVTFLFLFRFSYSTPNTVFSNFLLNPCLFLPNSTLGFSAFSILGFGMLPCWV